MPKRKNIYNRLEQLEHAERIRQELQARRQRPAPDWRNMKQPPSIKRSELKTMPRGFQVPSWHIIDDE